MLRRLILALVALSAPAAAAPPRYDNAKYGLSFDLPPDADVCRSPAPLPNHGLLFRPASVTSPPCDGDIEDGARYTAVDAHFDADAATTAANFVDTTCPQMAYDSRGKVAAIPVPMRRDGLASTGCRIDGMDGSIEEIVFIQRVATEAVPTIDYTLSLKTTPRDYPADHARFLRWLATVRIDKPS